MASAIEIIHGVIVPWANDMRPFEAFVKRVLDPLISPALHERPQGQCAAARADRLLVLPSTPVCTSVVLGKIADEHHGLRIRQAAIQGRWRHSATVRPAGLSQADHQCHGAGLLFPELGNGSVDDVRILSQVKGKPRTGRWSRT